jgi:2-polyprenyl-6-methoxyphenol hydroxylase-like FAD-dependent oxidoreductase
MPLPGQRKAVIAGGSVGGLFVGNMLMRQGWAVEIFERVAGGLESRGAGIAGHAASTGTATNSQASTIRNT